MEPVLRVLVLEDEWLIATEISATLERSGHRVIGPFASAQQAEETIQAGELDAALLDVRLAEGHSFAVADACLEAGIPFAFVTGVGSVDLPVLFASCPILRKPFSEAALVAQIRSLAGEAPSRSAAPYQNEPSSDASAR
ncbi:response regulator [Plastoroseomonas hellenica]|uniref:response regulator n=1 Tax=Plastoroseomonas hellenica TaxID=2687306 RepID=UPI001BAE446D|nr:response regulator [Plastoroseomonas hellenica]MBR0646851.1 response regulator [Plastoroseomonas hellenica]